MKKYSRIFIIIFILSLISGNNSQLINSPTPLITSEPVPLQIHSLSPTPTPELIDSYTKLERINPENVERLALINQIGNGAVSDVIISPDQKFIAVATGAGNVSIYNSQTLEKTMIINKPADHLAFSPDGKTLAISKKNLFYLYTFPSINIISSTISSIADWDITKLEFSQDNNRLIVSTKRIYPEIGENNINHAIYDLNGNLIFDHYSYVDSPAFVEYRLTTDGKIYFFQWDLDSSTLVDNWYGINLSDGAIIDFRIYQYLKKGSQYDSQFFYDIDPQGKVFAQQTYKNGHEETNLVDVKTKRILQTVNGIIQFLQPVNGKLTWKNRGEPDEIVLNEKCQIIKSKTSVSYQLLTANQNLGVFYILGRLELWDLNQCTILKTVLFPSITKPILSPNDRQIVSSNGLDTFIWDIQTGELILTVFGKAYHELANEFVFNQNGDHLNRLVDNLDKDAAVWMDQKNFFINFSPDGKILISNDSQHARFWDPNQGILLAEVKPPYSIENLSFSPDQYLIALNCNHGQLCLWGIKKE